MNHAEKARDLFREGYNCAQSVVGAFHEEMGLSLSEATRLASSFGGGMGGLRETCGAVTGMFLTTLRITTEKRLIMPVSASWLSSFARSMTRWSVGNCCDPCRRNSRKTRSRVPNNITRYAPVCGSWKQQRNCWTKCCKSSDGKIDETKMPAKNGLCRHFLWNFTNTDTLSAAFQWRVFPAVKCTTARFPAFLPLPAVS